MFTSFVVTCSLFAVIAFAIVIAAGTGEAHLHDEYFTAVASPGTAMPIVASPVADMFDVEIARFAFRPLRVTVPIGSSVR